MPFSLIPIDSTFTTRPPLDRLKAILLITYVCVRFFPIDGLILNLIDSYCDDSTDEFEESIQGDVELGTQRFKRFRIRKSHAVVDAGADELHRSTNQHIHENDHIIHRGGQLLSPTVIDVLNSHQMQFIRHPNRLSFFEDTPSLQYK